jgi:hypothetical protein
MKARTARKHVAVVGVADDGKLLLGGAFFFHDTVGLPLGEQMIRCRSMATNTGVSLRQFIIDARDAGWSEQRIAGTLNEELCFAGVPASERESIHGLQRSPRTVL